MAPLLSRKRVIKVKIETTKGVYVAGDQALLVFDLDINPTAPYIERRGSGLYLGQTTPGVIGERSGKCSFKIEMRSAGSAAADLGVAILLQACGFAKSAEVYSVHSLFSAQKTISVDVYEDGVLKSLAGCMGEITFEGQIGQLLFLNVELQGRWITPTDSALPAYAPGATLPMKLQGGAFSMATVAKKITKFSLRMGNKVVLVRDVNNIGATSDGGIAYAMITDFDPTVSFDVEADTVAGKPFYTQWIDSTEAAISMSLNDGAYKATFALPKVQYKEIKSNDRDGVWANEIVGQCNMSSGNDAVTITVAAV